MSSSSSRPIVITHVINPHLFWYKHCNDSNRFVDEIENDLKKYVSEHGEQMCAARTNANFECGMFVAANMRNKWIRAEIDVYDDDLIETDEVIVWATDYGIPLRVTISSIVILNKALQEKCQQMPSTILKGGISNIYPGKSRLNDDNKMRTVRVEQWQDKAVEFIQKIKNEYKKVKNIRFAVEFQALGHTFGHLVLEKENENKSVADILETTLKYAQTVHKDNFLRNFANVKTWKIERWLNNSGEVIEITENAKNVDIEIVTAKKPENAAAKCVRIQQPTASTSTSPSSPIIRIDQEKILSDFYAKLKTKKKRSFEEKNEENCLPATVPTVQNPKSRAVAPKQATAQAQTTPSTVSRLERLNKVLMNRQQAKSAPQNSAKSESSKSTVKSRSEKSEPITVKNLSLGDIEPCNLINELKQVRILKYNNDEEPNNLSEANFTSNVHKGLKFLNMTETYPNQGYAWPNLMRGNSLVLIDSKRRGKTITYLPAVCSLVTKEVESKERRRMGVTAIIVCLTASVSNIAQLCRDMLQFKRFESHIIEAVGTTDTTLQTVTVKLYNGCNILVTTPPCLKKLITKSADVIKNGKLKCVAFENIDCMKEKHLDTLDFIIDELCLRKSYKPNEVRQFIVTSRTWDKYINKFMNEKLIADSVLLIGNYLEAAFWGRVIIQITLSPKDEKKQKLLDHINELKFRKERTIVICNEATDAADVADLLRSNQISVELVKSLESSYSKGRLRSFWDNIEGVVVCDDEHLKDTGITNVQHMIHYNVPKNDFLKFLFRLSAMIDSHGDGSNATSSASQSSSNRPTSTILIDDDNYKHLPKFVDLLKRGGQTISPMLADISEKARMKNLDERAHKQRYENICNYVFMYGSIEHGTDCSHRHMILSSDIVPESERIIQNGHIRFHVLKIISPTEYVVRPMMQLTENNKWIDINRSNEFICCDLKLQGLYKNLKSAEKLPGICDPTLGDKCVVQVDEKFYRAEIIEIDPKKSPIDLDRYSVRLIDTGDVHMRAFTTLNTYALDKSFQEFPHQAYKLHLTGIIPVDTEDDWDPSVCERVKNELHKKFNREKNVIYEANVLFTLRNTIVVDVMRMFGETRGVVHCALKSYLKTHRYGIYSDETCKKVLKMAKSKGIKTGGVSKIKPKIIDSSVSSLTNGMENLKVKDDMSSEHSSKTNQDESSVSWEEETKEKWACPWKAQHEPIEIACFDWPNDFYIYKKSERLKELQNAIDKYAKEFIEPAKDNSMREVDIDVLCLVSKDGEYHRGKTVDVAHSENPIELVEVFLVDQGITVQVEKIDIYEIPDHLVEMLPFQAIWCKLVGINPIDGEEWKEEKIYEMRHLINEYDGEYYLHTVSSDKKAEAPYALEFPRYDIVLLAVHDNQQVNINELIVTNGLAAYDDETKEKLENIPCIVDEDDDGIFEGNNADEDWESSANSSFEMINPEQDSGEDFGEMFCNFAAEDFMQFLRGDSSSSPIVEPSIEELRNEENAIAQKPNKLQRIEECQETEDNLPVNKKPVDTVKDAGYQSTEAESEPSEEGGEKVIKTDHPLEFFYKRPKIEWQQTEETLVLRISASDNIKYGLNVTIDSLTYTAMIDEERVAAMLHLFGPIDIEYTKHEIRGLNVVVRLQKSFPLMWPRLVTTAKKCPWIIHSVEASMEEDAPPGEINPYGLDDDDDDLQPISDEDQFNGINLSDEDFYSNEDDLESI